MAPNATRMAPARSTSSSRVTTIAQPTVPHHEANGLLPYEMVDSADPFIGDMIYRLDDQRGQTQPQQDQVDERVAAAQGERPEQQQQQQHQSQQRQPLAAQAPADHLDWLKDLPWYQRPSVWWLVPFAGLLAIGSGATMSSKVELFTQIVCEEILATKNTPLTASALAPDHATSWLRLPLERPPMSSTCRTNPDVIAGSATLQLKVTMSMGILSALTTGFWGGLSDRKGRTRVLAIALFGVLLVDASFLTVGLMPISSLPGGTHFLLISAAIEGALGGLATIIAAHQAYISDCTPSGTRAKVYAQLAGFFYCGFVIGPALGGWMVKALNSLMSTFVLGAATHLTYFLIMLFVVPESTSPERRRAAARDYVKAAHGQGTMQGEPDVEYAIRLPTDDGSPPQRTKRTFRKRLVTTLSTPFRPLALLLPRSVDETERLQSRPASHMPSFSQLRAQAASMPAPDPAAASSHISVSHISRARKRDWNLTLLSLAYGLEMCMMGILSIKALYAQEVFDWGASELGFFMTTTSFARVLCLTVVLPVIIRVCHRPPKSVALPQDSGNDTSEGYLDDEGRQSRRTSVAAGEDDDDDGEAAPPPHHTASVEELWTMRAKQLRLLHDSHFDLKLARVSVGIAVLAYLIMALIRGPIAFICGTLLTALAGGGGASMSSLALAILQQPNQAGQLFGSWSILSAIFSTVIGPLFFTWVFKSTVHTAPYAFFWAGIIILCLSLACLSAVRIRKPRSLPALPPRPRRSAGAEGVGRYNDVDADADAPRRSTFDDDDEETLGNETR